MSEELKFELIDKFTESCITVYDKLYSQAESKNKLVIWVIGLVVAISIFAFKIEAIKFSNIEIERIGSLLLFLIITGIAFQFLNLMYLNKNMVLAELYTMQSVALKYNPSVIELESFSEIYKKVKFFKYIEKHEEFIAHRQFEQILRVITIIVFYIILGTAFSILTSILS